ncbi:MAG: hypothetical protein HQL32_06190 [Planctomycetes bacterium]|nr:hypothetical protein [Planctomycetota bacterium]
MKRQNRNINIFVPWLVIAFLTSFPPGTIQSDDNDFFALPSPNEILIDSESNGLVVEITKENSAVLRTNLKTLAQKNKIEASFAMGRIFSIAGFSFKKLNNKVILSLAAKIYKGMSAMELPEKIHVQIMGYYQKMIMNPKWNRSELLLSFTSARSSLLYLLKDPLKVSPEERPVVQSYSCALELGLWFQSMYLALDNLNENQVEAFTSIYIDEDVFIYFKKCIGKSLEHEKHPIFVEFNSIISQCEKHMEADSLSYKQCMELKKSLAEVIK